MARSGSRMKKSCDCCKRYLDHLEENKQSMTYFLRRMTASSKQSMIIPNRFLKHFAGKLSGTIKLEAPNRSLYDVEVTEHLNQTVLQRGWERFIDVHDIKENESLLFRHIESSLFEVRILDSDGCEKMFSCAGIRSTQSIRERTVDYVDISSNSQHATTESSGGERFARCEKGSSSGRGKTAKRASASSSSDESGEDVASEDESLESDDLQTSPGAGADYVMSNRSYLSETQKDRVVALIQQIEPKFTVFVSVMRKSYVQDAASYLAISKEYVSAYFPHGTTNVTFQRPDNSQKWHPKLFNREGRTVYMLMGQWFNFVRDNHVQEGDICLLMPTKDGRSFTFTVYLLRATATHSRCATGFQRAGPCPGKSSAKMDLEEAFGGRGRIANMDTTSSSSEKMDTPSSLEKMNTSLSSDESGAYISSENESFESDGLQTTPGVDYVVSCRTYLSETQKERVAALIQEIEPEVTVFVSIMRKCHVQPPGTFLTISKEYAYAYFPHETTNITLQRPGKSKKWHPKFYKRKEQSVYMLRGQWLDFVRDNHVHEGDICLLSPTKGGRRFTFTVHLLRATAVHSKCGTDFQSVSSCNGRSSTNIALEADVKEEPTDEEHHSLGSGDSLDSEDYSCQSQPPYFVPQRSGLSKSQKTILEERVRAIRSEVPIYVAIMRKSGVGASPYLKLELSSRYATAVHLPTRGQTVVLQYTRKIWKAKMVIRNGRRWFLTAGWNKFVRDNGLRVGDICLLQLKENERKLTMAVHTISREHF